MQDDDLTPAQKKLRDVRIFMFLTCFSIACTAMQGIAVYYDVQKGSRESAVIILILNAVWLCYVVAQLSIYLERLKVDYLRMEKQLGETEKQTTAGSTAR